MGEYEELKKMVLAAIRRNGSCKPGYKAVLSAGNIGLFCAVLKEYWPDVIGMHKSSSFHLFEEFYEVNKDGFNRYGIHYNESADSGYVLVTGETEGVVVSGTAKAWVYGTGKVTGKDLSHIRARENSVVVLEDDASGLFFDSSEGHAYGRSRLSASDKSRLYAYDLSTVDAGGKSTVYGISWNRINGFGNALIKAHTDRKIKLSGNARLEIIH